MQEKQQCYSYNNSVNVVNNKGFTLPTTGGKGTNIYNYRYCNLWRRNYFFSKKRKNA